MEDNSSSSSSYISEGQLEWERIKEEGIRNTTDEDIIADLQDPWALVVKIQWECPTPMDEKFDKFVEEIKEAVRKLYPGRCQLGEFAGNDKMGFTCVEGFGTGVQIASRYDLGVALCDTVLPCGVMIEAGVVIQDDFARHVDDSATENPDVNWPKIQGAIR